MLVSHLQIMLSRNLGCLIIATVSPVVLAGRFVTCCETEGLILTVLDEDLFHDAGGFDAG